MIPDKGLAVMHKRAQQLKKITFPAGREGYCR
jgi:hypothetical protein